MHCKQEIHQFLSPHAVTVPYSRCDMRYIPIAVSKSVVVKKCFPAVSIRINAGGWCIYQCEMNKHWIKISWIHEVLMTF